MSEHIIYKQVRDFNDEQIKLVATTYATTPLKYTAKSIAIEFSRDGEYTIKPRTISKLIQKAIKNALVSETVAKQIRKKAIEIAKLHSKRSAQITMEKYDCLLQERKEFIENGYRHIRKKIIDEKPVKSNEEYENSVQEELTNLKKQLMSLLFQIDSFGFYSDSDSDLNSLLRKKEEIEHAISLLEFYHPH